MAARVDLGSQELNFIFKSLAEKGEDGTLYEKGNKYFSGVLLQYLSYKLQEKTENCIVIKEYGSAAEGSTCYEPCDVGDVDIMIFPNSPKLTIHEEQLEYSLENPLHVRIRGSHHSALQSFLVKHTEYVATSAVKNFHPAIFGYVSSKLVNITTRTIQALSSLETLSPICTANLKNKRTSPALTLNMSQSLGTVSHILKQWDMLTSKETQSVPSFTDVAGKESTSSGILDNRYRRQVELVKYIVQKCRSTNDLQFLQMILVALSQEHFSRGEKIGARLQDTESRSQNKAVYSDQQFDMSQKNGKDDESRSNRQTCTDVTSLSNNGSNVTVTTEKCENDRSSSQVSRQSAMPRDSAESSSRLPEEPMSKQVTKREGTEGKGREKNGGNSCESKNGSKSVKQQKKKQSTSKDLPSHPDDKEEDEKIKHEIRAMYNRWVEHLFGAGTQTEEAKLQGTENAQLHERVQFGMDIVPAFRYRGWPKVAEVWISRERK